LPQQPKILQEPTNTTESPKTIFGPTDFSLDFKEYTTEDGCKSFGSIVVKDQVLTAQIGAQPYAITIASATTEFYTCTNDAKVTYKNGELDTDKNTYPEIVALDVTSLTYGAVLKNVNLSMKPVTPKEQLKDEGTDKEACIIFNVCKIDTSKIAELPKEVTDVVLASAKAQIVSTAQETFAKVEHKAMIEDAVNELLKQADELQVSRELVQFALVNGKGAVVNAVPNYGSPLLKTTLKNENAAITNKDLKGIFGEVSIEMEYIPNESPRG
jgi:peptide methionine sulfoxide reductase MsrA